MAERYTRIPGKQITERSVKKGDLDATGETTGYVLTVQADGSVDWEASTGGGTTYKTTFVNGDLSSSKITITHNLNTEHPAIALYDGDDELTFPTYVRYLTVNTIELDFTDMPALVGTYKIRVIGSGGIVGHTIQDADNDTKVQTEESTDEDIIRFDVAGTQEAQMDANGLTLKSGTSVNEFSTDGTMAGNSDDAVPTEKAVKTFLTNNYSTIADKDKNEANILINAFRIAVNGALSVQKMVDGMVDEYEDETGIDTVNSLNESYNSTDDYYSPDTLYTLTTSPYFHAKCNDNAGNTTVTDNGTGANNGTASTNTSNLSITGKINNCFDFNGTDEYVNLDNLLSDIFSDTLGTFSFWMNLDTFGSGSIYGFGDTDGSQWMQCSPDGVNKLLISCATGGTNQWVMYNTSALSTGTWYHVAIVHDGISPKVYINGLEETNITVTTDLTFWFSDGGAIDNGRIGCQNRQNLGNVAFLNGKIDDFRYYQNKALTSDEVKAIYNSGSGTEADQPESGAKNITLISDSFTAEAQPDSGRLVVLEEDIDAITLNTDLKAYASRDGGTSWVQGTLADEGDYDASKRILVADFDFTASGIGTGTSMEYKLESANNKDLKLHASALTWD